MAPVLSVLRKLKKSLSFPFRITICSLQIGRSKERQREDSEENVETTTVGLYLCLSLVLSKSWAGLTVMGDESTSISKCFKMFQAERPKID